VPQPRIEGDEIVLDAPLPEAKELGARLDKARGVYTLPATRLNATMVRDAIPDAPDLRDALVTPWTPVDDDRLYPYQRDIAGRLRAARHGAVVVVSPGLGKTACSIAAADSLPRGTSVLVICPASLVATWWREIEKWGRANRSEWAVETWDKAARLARFGGGQHGGGLGQWDVVILDESVMTKSRSSQRYKSFKKVRKYWKRVWLLSGNPVTRYADDMWTQLNLLWPKAFPSYWRFADRFCVTEETPWARKVVGTRRGRNVMEENDDLVIVVNQEEVLELPEYLFEVVDVDLRPRQRRAYDSMAKDFIAELGDGTEVVADNEVGRLQKLQQIASWWDDASAKHDALIDLLPTFEGPHLIWTHWVAGAAALVDRLGQTDLRIGHVGGATRPKDRDTILEEFKAGELDALVLSIGVGKFGHTFTNARTVHYVDKTWNADDYFQSLRRVRRIGLTHRPVVVTYRAPGTTDELVEANLEGKLTPISRMTRSDLAELLRGLGREGT
jgi:SNF2 family DNA or RNA helicase